MATLTVTARGQATLPEDVLQHLGIQPGGKIRLDLLPDGRVGLRADQPKESRDQLHGMLQGKGNGVVLSTEELDEAIGEATAEAGMAGMEKR